MGKLLKRIGRAAGKVADVLTTGGLIGAAGQAGEGDFGGAIKGVATAGISNWGNSIGRGGTADESTHYGGGGAIPQEQVQEHDRKEAAKKAAAEKERANDKIRADRRARRLAGEAAAKQQADTAANIERENAAGNVYSPRGNDLTNPGQGEQAVDIHGGEYFEPGRQEQYLDKYGGAFERNGIGETTNARVARRLEGGPKALEKFGERASKLYDKGAWRSNEVYDQFAPNVASNMDGFYADAWGRGSSDINRQLAATGSFGSSRGMQQLTGFSAQLRGDQAQQEAKYQLDRQRLWGEQANVADDNSRAYLSDGSKFAETLDDNRYKYLTGAGKVAMDAQDAKLNRIKTGAGLEGDVDEFGLKSRDHGIAAYGSAQDAREGRIGDRIDREMEASKILLKYGNDRIASNFDAEGFITGVGLADATDRFNGSTGATNSTAARRDGAGSFSPQFLEQLKFQPSAGSTEADKKWRP